MSLESVFPSKQLCGGHRQRLALHGHRTATVRVATRDDREQVIRVINTVASERQHLQTDFYRPTASWEKVLREGTSFNAGLLLLVENAHGRVIGFARLTPYQEDTCRCAVGNVGIALLKPYRSLGIGSMLLRKLIASAPLFGLHELEANVLSRNLHSRNLFHKHGFAVSSIRKINVSFLKNPVDEILFKLDLAFREVACHTPLHRQS